jgi:peptide/nickel transport system ATP-binding protein
LLCIEDLHVTFMTRQAVVPAVRGVSFTMRREKLGIVGESGSGKTQMGRAILGLVSPPGQVKARRLEFAGMNLLGIGAKQWRAIRGKRITMVMQDPKYSLNPVMPIGSQIAEAYRAHSAAGRAGARRKVLDMLTAVRIRDPERVYAAYPHEVSGGMGQRIMIAMMLITEPELLIADEPTSALDVTVQLQVLAILDDLVSQRGMGLILISHDLNLVGSFCDRLLVTYGGRVLEELNTAELAAARHPYTRGLLCCQPQIADGGAPLPVLERDPAWLV